MDAPRIRYATSADGVEIAYAVFGSGPPLLLVDQFLAPGIDSRLAGPETDFYEVLAQEHTIALLDWPGVGLSRPAADLGLASLVGVMKGVVDQLKWQRFDLWGWMVTCHVTLAFTVAYPERIRKLVLTRPRPKGRSFRNSGVTEPIAHLASSDWDAYVDLFGLRMFGWSDLGRQFQEQMRKNWTAESFAAFGNVVEAFDSLLIASSIGCETLVIATDEAGPVDTLTDLQSIRQLAAALPNSQLVLTPAAGHHSVDQVKSVNAFLADLELTDFSAGEGPVGISHRELEVLRLIAAGRSNAQIADALVISPNTVGRHVSNIFDKIGAANRAEATAYALRNGVA